MGGASAGFLQFMQDQQSRDRQQVEVQALQQQMQQRRQQADMQAQAAARQRDAVQGWGPLLSNMPPPAFQQPPQMPQPPAPGTNSAQPAPMPQAQAPGGGAGMPQLPAPPGPPPAAMPQPQPQAQPPAPPQPDQWKPMPTAQAPQPGGGGGGAPQQLPPPPSAAPPGGAGGMPPMPQMGNADQFALPNLIKMLKEGNVPPEKWGDMLDNLPEPVKNNAAQQIRMMHEQQAQLVQWANLALRARTADQGDRRLDALEDRNQSEDERRRALTAQGDKRIAAKAGKGGGGAPTISPETVDFYATQSIGGMSDWQVGLARGKIGQQLIGAVKDRIPSLAKELGLSPMDVGTNKAIQVGLSASNKQLTQRANAIEQSSKKIDKDIVTLNRFLESGTAGGVRLTNEPINKIREKFSSPELGELMIAAQIVGTEYERMINGGLLSVAQLHEGAREDAKKLINADMTPKEMKARLAVMLKEIENQKSAFKEQIGEVQGQMRKVGSKDDPVARSAPGPTIDQSGKGPKVGEKRTINGTPAHWDGKGWLAD